jgi:hypothetical protein
MARQKITVVRVVGQGKEVPGNNPRVVDAPGIRSVAGVVWLDNWGAECAVAESNKAARRVMNRYFSFMMLAVLSLKPLNMNLKFGCQAFNNCSTRPMNAGPLAI